MYFYLSILLMLIGLVFLIKFIFSKRYERTLVTKLVTVILGISFLIAVATFRIISKDIDKQTYSNTEWQHMKTQQSITKLEYRPDAGLFAIKGIDEFKIAGKNPFCVNDGQLSGLKPREIEIADTLPSELSSPPQATTQQINFILRYPIDADEIGFSSFAVFENGEIWCTERYMRGGLGGGVAVGVLGFVFLVISALVFVGSFILLLTISIISLEIHRRRQDSSSE